MDDAVLPSDFLQALRLSLTSSENLVDALANTGGAPQNGHIKKLIEAVLWHRKFIVTYYIWIAAVVAICGARTLYKKRQSRNKNGKGSVTETIAHRTPETGLSSSSSSTLTGSSTPPQKDLDLGIHEATPLLSKEHILSERDRPSAWNRIQSFLLYQPQPIPGLTSPSNTLPDNGTSLLILFFLALNLFYLFFRAPLTVQWIFILVDRAGLLFVANLPVLYILAAKNNQPIKSLTGWSYEGLNIFHRRLGEWMTWFAVLHMFGMLLVWYTILRPLGFTFLRYLTSRVVFMGVCAIISYYVIYITSVGWFRHLYYEAFLGLHIFFQFAALVFLFFHYPTARPYVGVALAIWVIDRGIWRTATASRKFIATLEVAPDGDTILLHADIPIRPKRSVLGLQPNLHHGWAPGQHVFLTIPSMGSEYRFQAHPFTIASSAPPQYSKAGTTSWPLQLTIRAINGFSRELLEYAKFHQHCEIILDGPYGSTSALEAAQAAERVCFVAGGSGIAVTYPLSWALHVSPTHEAEAAVSTRITYSNGARVLPPAVLQSEPLVPAAKYAHFWIRQDEKHQKWITTVPKASAVNQDSPPATINDATTGARDGPAEQVANLVTRAFDTRSPGPDGGRPDMKTELWEWITSAPTPSGVSSPPSTVPGIASPESLSGGDALYSPLTSSKSTKQDKVCIIVSGPDGLVRDVRNISAELVCQGWDVDVHVEKFGW